VAAQLSGQRLKSRSYPKGGQGEEDITRIEVRKLNPENKETTCSEDMQQRSGKNQAVSGPLKRSYSLGKEKVRSGLCFVIIDVDTGKGAKGMVFNVETSLGERLKEWGNRSGRECIPGTTS